MRRASILCVMLLAGWVVGCVGGEELPTAPNHTTYRAKCHFVLPDTLQFGDTIPLVCR